jgi:hypothetical protein
MGDALDRVRRTRLRRAIAPKDDEGAEGQTGAEPRLTRLSRTEKSPFGCRLGRFS